MTCVILEVILPVIFKREFFCEFRSYTKIIYYVKKGGRYNYSICHRSLRLYSKQIIAVIGENIFRKIHYDSYSRNIFSSKINGYTVVVSRRDEEVQRTWSIYYMIIFHIVLM